MPELLNRLRLRKRMNQCSKMTLLCLKNVKRVMADDSTNIHIYATNSEVDVHNIHMLHKLCSDTVTVKHKTLERNPKTGPNGRKRWPSFQSS